MHQFLAEDAPDNWILFGGVYTLRLVCACVCVCVCVFVCNLLHITLLASRFFRLFLYFCNMCGPRMKPFLPITFRTQNIRNCHRHIFVPQSAGARSHLTQPYTRHHRQGLPRFCRGEWHVSVHVVSVRLISIPVTNINTCITFYFRCYTVHAVELLNYYTNYCTYIKFIKFIH